MQIQLVLDNNLQDPATTVQACLSLLLGQYHSMPAISLSQSLKAMPLTSNLLCKRIDWSSKGHMCNHLSLE